ncbi:MAG: extracellular solute-binding protein [Lachnospiraceae bacterium]
MKAKKVIALLLSAVMTLSLAACGDKEASQTPESTSAGNEETTASVEPTEETNEGVDLSDIIPEETVTLDVYDQLANYSGEQVGWFAEVMLEKFNVKLNIISNAEGVFATRMESGDLGDIVIWGDDSNDYQQAIEQGMLFDWNEDDLLDEYGPYIKEHMTFALEKNKEISGGTVYGIGHDIAVDAEARQDIMYQWDLRWDLYKELGYPEIKDLDDMVDVLAQMKEICPTDDKGKTTYGVSLFNDWDGDMVMFVKSTASAYYGYDEFGFGLYDPETQTYHPCLEKDGPYLTCLKFYNTLYQKGLLDPDSQTQKYDGMVEDFQNGTAFMNVFNFLGSSLYNSEAHAAEGKAMYPCPPSEARPIAYGQNVYGGNRPWTIGAKTEYPELCMAIINWLCTPEGRMVSEYGPEGVCWYYDENGKTCFTDLGRTAKLDGKTNMTDGYTGAFEDGNFKMNNTTWALDAENLDSNGDTFNYKKWESYNSEPGSDIEADWREFTGCNTFDERMGQTNYRLAPGTMYSNGVKSDELSVVWNQVAECIKSNSWKAIYAKSDDEYNAIVDEMIKQAEEYGYDECIEFQMEQVKLRAACEDAVRK